MATGRIDLRGAALAALGLAGTTYALIEAPGKGASAAVLVAGDRRRRSRSSPSSSASAAAPTR